MPPGQTTLDRVTEVCLALPESTRQMMGRHAAFLVRGKKFAYFLHDHHGDGIVSICVRTGVGANEDMARADPQRFYLPAYIAHRGWVAYRLDTPTPDWDIVRDLVEDSYRLSAPKSLVAAVRPR